MKMRVRVIDYTAPPLQSSANSRNSIGHIFPTNYLPPFANIFTSERKLLYENL